MYLLIAGGGKVGSNLARALIRDGHEVTLIEQRPARFDMLEAEFEHQVHRGDATELFVLERAGIKRPPDVVVAVTGDDEDNIVICQIARDRYGVETTIARVNDPRNQPYFDLLGISPTVSATASIMALIEHEVPEHGLIQLLELRKENLEIVEVSIDKFANCKGKRVRALKLPDGARLISVVRDGKATVPDDETQLEAGDQVLAILEGRSAAEQQLVGWPLPASDVERTESMRSRVAIFFRAGMSDARSRAISRGVYHERLSRSTSARPNRPMRKSAGDSSASDASRRSASRS